MVAEIRLFGANSATWRILRINHIVVRLFCAALPKFDSQPEDISVMLQQTARFPCYIQAIPPASIYWYKNDQPLNLDRSRMLVLPSGALEINRVVWEDVGKYRCRAENVERHRWSSEGNLSIDRDNSNDYNLIKIALIFL